MSKASQFIKELKRRRVYSAAVAYIVVGLGVLGGAEVILDPLGLGSARRLIVIVTLLGFPIAMVLAWIYDLTPTGSLRDSEMDDGTEESAAEALRPVSQNDEVSDGIVVLPFENLSAHKEDEYFSDGVTEDLITQLYRIGSLRVISRTSAWQYKARRVGTKQIAGDLGVAYLLQGSVWRSGSRVRIVAQLIDARRDRHMWAETYDRELEDIFEIQSEVANRIASALHLTLTGTSGGPPVDPESAMLPRATEKPLLLGPDVVMTSDLEAYDSYLRGRYLWNRRGETELNESVSYLAAAVERDPRFVGARCALAEAYVTLAIYGLRSAQEVLPMARRQADEALGRHPAEAPALSALACVRAIYQWEWARAEVGFAGAIEASPQYPIAPQWLAMNVLVPQGRFDGAVSQLERARELDPLSPSVQASFGVVDFMRRDYPRARERFDLLVQQDPGFQFAHFFGGLSLLYGGDAGRASESLQRAMQVGGWSPEVAAALGCAFVAEGREARGRETVGRMRTESAERYVSPVRISLLQSALSDHDAALDSLDEAVTSRATDLIWLDVHPGFDALRDHPRFRGVRQRIFQG